MSNKSESLATFKFDQAAKDELASIVSEGGGSSSKEVQSAVANHGLGWVEEGQPRDEVAITWDGNLEGVEQSPALKYLLEQNGQGPESDTYKFYVVKVSDEIQGLPFDSIFWTDSRLDTGFFEAYGDVLICSSYLSESQLDDYTNLYSSIDYAGASLVICREDHEVDVNGETLIAEKGMYFIRHDYLESQDQETYELIGMIYPTKFVIKPSIKNQEEIKLSWDGEIEGLEPADDLKYLLQDYFEYSEQYIRTLYRVGDPLDISLSSLANKRVVITMRGQTDPTPGYISDEYIYSVWDAHNIQLPSITDLYIATNNMGSILCVIIGQDINIIDPLDPQYSYVISAGTYFRFNDQGHGEIEYVSDLVLQEEDHVKEEVHKIDDKFISGPMFIYAPYDSSINLYVMDKTFGEIKEAFNANVPMFFNIGNYQYPSKIGFDFDGNRITCYVAEKQEMSNNLMFQAYSFTADSDNDYPTAPPFIS